MWGRPVRQATAVDDDGRALVHRNEINEQQRPGDLVLLPRKCKVEGKETPRWCGKLIRSMATEGNLANVKCDGLLFYTGAFIADHSLDKKSQIAPGLKKLNVLFVTNHVDDAACQGMVSSMRGTPVELGPNGHLVNVRTKADLGPGLDDDDTVDEHDERFLFGGFVAFDFNNKGKPTWVGRCQAPRAPCVHAISVASRATADMPPCSSLTHVCSR